MLNMHKKILGLALSALILVSGCNHSIKAVNNVPAGVSQTEVKDW